MAPSGFPFIGFHGLTSSHSSQTPTPASTSPPQTPGLSTSSISDSTSTSEQSFNDPTTMPPPGVAHFEARRARWLTPPAHRVAREPSPSTSRAKLEALLAAENAISSDEVWNAGIRNVWKGLVGGGRLRRRLPLSIVLKILQAGWLRDGTWPSDAAGVPLPVTRAPPPPIFAAPPRSPKDEDDVK